MSGTELDGAEAELLRRALDGDEEAFVSLYGRHRDPVYRFSFRMLGSAPEAEDVVHDCLLALLRRPSGYDPVRSPLRAYLYGIARHNIWARLRRRAGTSSLDESEADPATDEPGPLLVLERLEVAEQVASAVASLAPLQREAIVLFEYEGLSLVEIAALSGVDVGTVSARLHRARGRLRRALAHLVAGSNRER